MSPNRTDAEPLVIVGAFPPPVNGYSTITSNLEQIVRTFRQTIPIDISPGTSQRGISYHVRRVRRVVAGSIKVVALRARHRSFDTYIATESRLGLIYTIAIAVAARAVGSYVYLHHHVFRYIDQHSILMRALLSVTKGHATHIFLSQSMRDSFERRYRSSVCYVVLSNLGFIPLPERMRLAPRENDGPLTVALLSNLSREKGLYEFLALAKAALQNMIAVRFVLAGPASTAEDAGAIAEATRMLGESFDYRGPLYGDQKTKFFQEADVFVFPTSYANEAQPLVVFEALAYGCHVVAFDQGCVSEQIAGRGTVIRKGSNFVDETLGNLQIFLSDRELLETSRRSLLQQIPSEHSGAFQRVLDLFAGTKGRT